jgi:hypothetical protein
VPHLPTRVLTAILVALVIGRLVFLAVDSNTFDVSAAGVIGADRVAHGLPLYVDNEYHGDTYGPINYISYIPAELVFPWSPGEPFADAARLATGMFDVLTLLGLFVLGMRLRPGATGRRLGVVLAYGWAAYPYTGLVLASNTNDALVPLFLVWTLVFARSNAGRGVLAAVASLTKFAPLAVAPLLISGFGDRRRRALLVAGGAFAAACVAIVVPFIPDGGLREFWDTTLGFQLGRTSPLSLWVRAPGLDWLRHIAQALTVALAAAAMFWPRRRSVGTLAALCAAVLAAAQLTTNYWIYFYLAWLLPFVLIALAEEHRDLGPAPREAQGSLINALLKDVRISAPSSVTTTRSSILTPNRPGR